ncbi:RanGTP-binding protein-domain-containing protein [Podospora didyma]|uniref:RanGTP-binding protein-domain-containing protein n=1 Tax=Podospora didyma TaxID=330526 RepID=A0AAE0NHF6_9PEZI|nr:RanGTP-binding protein-domain-containing protein [Podospora didyma]
MDLFLASLGAQAYSLIQKRVLTFTSTYALEQCSRLLKTVNDKALRKELRSLQKQLDHKIRILSPAIDLIQFKSGRGNVFLESAVPLAKSLHREIVRLGKRLDNAATVEEGFRRPGRKASMSEAQHAELTLVIKDIRSLLERIDRDINLIQFAITASGEKLSSSATPGISMSRMMQASSFLFFGDSHFTGDPSRPVQIGPSFTLSLYMLFLGHSPPDARQENDNASLSTQKQPESVNEGPYGIQEGERKPIWQEVMHKARVRLCRTPLGWSFDTTRGYRPSRSAELGAGGISHTVSIMGSSGRPDEYSYHLEIIEDLDDGRLHEEEGPRPQPFPGMPTAGLRESIPIHQLAKLFYVDTRRILNIGNTDGDNNPILLMKRDINARSPIGIRRGWFEESSDSDEEDADEFVQSDDQTDIDRQLREEGQLSVGPADKEAVEGKEPGLGHLPPHLDPEWLAFEVFTEDYDSDDTEDEEDQESGSDDHVSDGPISLSCRPRTPQDRSSIDSKLLDQIRKVSLRATPPQEISRLSSEDVPRPQQDLPESYVVKSPFGTITSSLSLLEMLVRLTSLQEFQQTSHQAIPDHILNFFLYETSTTGLRGEAQWRMRKATKSRVGFDPYTDTPTK